MKIVYEKGDHASVEDNVEAGELAACGVELIAKNGTNWYCENLDTWINPTKFGFVDEEWLSPR